MKTIKDFKAAMQVGSSWGYALTNKVYDSPSNNCFIKRLDITVNRGIVKCKQSNARGFWLNDEFHRWPRKDEFTANGNTININDPWYVLQYTFIM